MFTIIQALVPAELNQAAQLIREHVFAVRSRYHDRTDLVDIYFNHTQLETELGALPGRYAEPDGALLLALIDGRAVGCIAMRGLGEEGGEVSHHYVRPGYQKRGIARTLLREAVNRAMDHGYESLRVDNATLLTEARSLFDTFGFVETSPYYRRSRGSCSIPHFHGITLVSQRGAQDSVNHLSVYKPESLNCSVATTTR